MKKITTLFFVFSLIVSSGVSQETFIRLYGDEELVRSYSLAPDGTKGYVVAGHRIADGFDMYLFRVNEYGDTLWTKRYDLDPEGDGNNYLKCINPTSDGNFIAGGRYNNQDLLVKLTPDGDTLWTKSYSNQFPYMTGYVKDVFQTDDGGYILGNQVIGQYDAARLVKTTEDGTVVWMESYQNLGRITLHAMSLCTDGYLVAGKHFNTDNLELKEQYFIMKTYSSGSVLWMRKIGDSEDDWAYSVIESSDGDVVSCGVRMDAENFNHEGFVIKMNGTNGNTIWSKSFNDENMEFNDIKETQDGGYIITGMVEDTGNKIILLKISNNGEEEWRTLYTGNSSYIFDFNTGEEVYVEDDGQIMVTGHCHDMNYSQAFLLKTNNQGLITGIERTNENSKKELIVYPNPFHNVLNIDMEGNGEIRIFSLSGKLIYSGNTKDKLFQWKPAEHIDKGLYIIQINNKKVNSQSKVFYY